MQRLGPWHLDRQLEPKHSGDLLRCAIGEVITGERHHPGVEDRRSYLGWREPDSVVRRPRGLTILTDNKRSGALHQSAAVPSRMSGHYPQIWTSFPSPWSTCRYVEIISIVAGLISAAALCCLIFMVRKGKV